MKFCGNVGYSLGTVEETGDREGNWIEKVEERRYYGDVTRNTRRWSDSNETVNDDLLLNDSFSIVADGYAYEHCAQIKYVRWMGACWKVTNVEIQRPRLLLTVGGVYNGQTA